MTFDFEPEDAWDVSDPLPDLIRNLGRRIALLDGLAEPRGTSLRALVEAIQHRLQVARRRRLDARALLRAGQLDEDLATVRARLERET